MNDYYLLFQQEGSYQVYYKTQTLQKETLTFGYVKINNIYKAKKSVRSNVHSKYYKRNWEGEREGGKKAGKVDSNHG